MAEYLDINKALELREAGCPVIDVRSPKEFDHAHMPGAYSIPLFNNDQRSAVGIIFKKKGRVAAVQKGLEYVGPKMADMTKEALEITEKLSFKVSTKVISKADVNAVIVYCWRGGMRSASMGWLFETVDIKVYLIRGGYKAYRREELELFKKNYNLTVLGGCTGAGKTDLLYALEKAGEQIIDLEGLANHRGSAFGSIGQERQPTSEYFEHLLFDKLRKMDIERNIWIEDESKNVGRVFVPNSFFTNLRNSDVIKIQVPESVRAARIIRDYGCFDKEALIYSIKKIEKRLGREKCLQAINCCNNDDYKGAVEICLYYYDKLYNVSMDKRVLVGIKFITFAIDSLDIESFLPSLIDQAREMEGRKGSKIK
ncbi:MAG: tRNA 2-selenouridine(34) synthase MnmH [Bacteroidales bacterium]